MYRLDLVVDKYAAMPPLHSYQCCSPDPPGNGTEHTDSIRASFSGPIRVGIMDRHVEHIPHSVIVPLNGSGLIWPTTHMAHNSYGPQFSQTFPICSSLSQLPSINTNDIFDSSTRGDVYIAIKLIKGSL